MQQPLESIDLCAISAYWWNSPLACVVFYLLAVNGIFKVPDKICIFRIHAHSIDTKSRVCIKMSSYRYGRTVRVLILSNNLLLILRDVRQRYVVWLSLPGSIDMLEYNATVSIWYEDCAIWYRCSVRNISKYAIKCILKTRICTFEIQFELIPMTAYSPLVLALSIFFAFAAIRMKIPKHAFT